MFSVYLKTMLLSYSSVDLTCSTEWSLSLPIQNALSHLICGTRKRSTEDWSYAAVTLCNLCFSDFRNMCIKKPVSFRSIPWWLCDFFVFKNLEATSDLGDSYDVEAKLKPTSARSSAAFASLGWKFISLNQLIKYWIWIWFYGRKQETRYLSTEQIYKI